MKKWDLKKIYKEAGITKQKMISRLGGNKLKHPAVQRDLILNLNRRIDSLDAAGYELFQLDECLFSPDSFHLTHWSYKRDPMKKTQRFTNLPKVVVCGVISPIRGAFYFHFGIRSFKAPDMEAVLRQIRHFAGLDTNIALFLDNARHHRAQSVQSLASS